MIRRICEAELEENLEVYIDEIIRDPKTMIMTDKVVIMSTEMYDKLIKIIDEV